MSNNYQLLRGSNNARSLARVQTTLAPARLMQVAATLLLVMALFMGNAQTASASHFRYGNVSWTRVSSDPTGRTIQFTINVGYRTTFFVSSVAIGDVVNISETFDFGDGTSTPLSSTVTSFSVPDNYFYGQSVVTHVYSSSAAATQRAFYLSGDRISTLQNNANGSYYVGATVTLGNSNDSPIATLSPIVNLAAGQSTATFQIPASDPNGNAITYSLAASSDLGNIGFVQPTGLSVSSTGLLTLNTTGFTNGQLYNAVVKLTDALGSITFLDFIIRISGSGNPPSFVYGGITPNNGSTITGAVGTPITFTVRATDTDPGDVVSIAGVGIPSGAVFAPSSGTPTATSSFSFTPTGTGTFVINFTATDVSGGQVQSSVTIQIGGVTPPVSGSALQLTMPTYVCATGAFTFNTTGGDGTPITFSAIGICSARVSNTSSLLDDVDAQLAQDIRDQKPNVQPLLLKASQSGVNVTYTWNALAACAGTTTTPPTPTTTSACGSPTATIGQALALVAPTYDCTTGVIKFNVTGGNGSPILFSAIGICSPTTNCIDGLDPGNTDNNTYTIKAQQGATVVTLSWTRPCASLRQGVEPGADLNVLMLGNPVADEAVEFEVRGADGQALRSVVTDSQGRILSERAVQQAGAIERQSLRLGRSAGLYFLNVSTGGKTTTVKVIKQ